MNPGLAIHGSAGGQCADFFWLPSILGMRGFEQTAQRPQWNDAVSVLDPQSRPALVYPIPPHRHQLKAILQELMVRYVLRG